jgi:membrane protease YdiL (CAAX protease family)
LAVILASEMLGWWIIELSDVVPLAVVGLIRMIQITAIGWLVVRQEGSLELIGWAPVLWMPGIKKGAVWSLAFGAVATVAMVALYISGQNPLPLVKSPLPPNMGDLLLFFAVGGLIAPVAEELCFRGIVYSFFRRWGILIALVASTAIFVALHTFQGLPVIQIVGGIVFAIAYETTGNLMVPITIHCLGNIAIFTLSLL